MRKNTTLIALMATALILASPLYASRLSYHAGIAASTGFFSTYAVADAGVKIDLSETFALGLNQQIAYGFTYQEVVGMTELRAYFYDDLYVHIGASYLLSPSGIAEKHFNTNVLPLLGFGLYIPVNASRKFFVVPRLEMNQSFYLNEEIKPIYTELPFPIGGQVSVAFVYRQRL